MPTVTRAMRIGESVARMYARWHDPAEVARFLMGVDAATPTGPDTVRWKLRGPIGFAMDVNARLTDDEPEHLMIWKAYEASFPAIVAVRFESLGDDETRVTLQLTADPPGGLFITRATENYLTRAVEDSLKRLAALVDGQQSAVSRE